MGTPRLSEGKLLSLIIRKCPPTVRDAETADNLTVFTSSSVCDLIIIGYNYPFLKLPSIEKVYRYFLLLLTTFV